jgi:hypothetical protein
MKNFFLALIFLTSFGLSAHANVSEWEGLYRGVCVIENTDGKRSEIQCELKIIGGSTSSPEMLNVTYSENAASIQIQNLSHPPKHLTVQLSETALGIAPSFAHPISIKLQKEPGGFDETLIIGDLIEYDVSYAQEPKTVSTLHLKLGKLQ